MNLLDKLVNEALKNKPEISSLRMVVEKEIIHYDIIRIMRDNNLMSGLCFIGGTCLRTCYGGIRLSEDLDFTGGKSFSRANLSSLGQLLSKNLQDKYGLIVKVQEPIKDKKNVDTWKIKIETRPENRNLPAQRINIDICALPSYETIPMMIVTPYEVDMGGVSGMIISVQSREEIYADKLIAFALRPNRIKYRDIWDIIWLHGKGVKPRLGLIPNKVNDRKYTMDHFLDLFKERTNLLQNNPNLENEFRQEMYRFLPFEQVNTMLSQQELWKFTTYLMVDFNNQFIALFA